MASPPVRSGVPLTPTQQGMLYHCLSNPRAGFDVEHVIGYLDEALDVAAFRSAWQRLVDRHDALRLQFWFDETAQPRQAPREHVDFRVDERDWRGLPRDEQARLLDAYIKEDRERGFDPRTDLPIRVALFQLGDDRSQMVWTWWHGALDGRARLILLRELFAYYEAFTRGDDLDLPEPRPFTDYAAWLAGHPLTGDDYWRDLLKGVAADTRFFPQGHEAAKAAAGGAPSDRTPAWDFGEHELRLSRAESDLLKRFADQQQVTVNALVQAAWSLVLAHHAGEDDAVFGVTRACRHAAFDADGTGESIVGVLINTLPVRVRIDPATTVVDWLKGLRAQHLAVRPYEHTPLVTAHAASGLRADQPLFETLVVFENQLLDSALRREPGVWDRRRFEIHGRPGLPLALYFYADAECVVQLLNDRMRVDDQTARALLELVVTALRWLVTNPAARLEEVSMLTPAERRRLVEEWNRTQAEYPDLSVVQLFEAQVARTPDAVAVTFEEQSLTYEGLNARANQLAALLRAAGAAPGRVVGVCIERSPEMVVAVMGVLKTGAMYVPLDPAFPAERLTFMLADSGASVLLTEKTLRQLLPAEGVRVVCVEETDAVAADSPVENPSPAATLDDLAYLLYTSGSTGQPKGVEITHRALTNFLWAMRTEPGCSARDVVLSVTTLSFDIAALELYLPLIVGARVELVSRDVASDGVLLRRRIEQVRPTLMQATPVTWRVLVEAGWSGTPGMTALCGGEAMPPDLVQPLLDRTAALWNMYGPTETTVWSSVQRVTRAGAPITIGRPIANTQFYILDARLQPVPVGVAGELFIGGVGVARGYRQRPALTAEKFIADPFSADRAARLFRTGDLARYRPDGQVVHLGRLDNQVKVRGYRIEPGEIEAVLRSHDAVADAAVAARGDQAGGTRLVGYVVGRQGPPNERELREMLRAKLPDYMVPSVFVMLDALPLTPNGKVDRRALPAPDFALVARDATFVAPRTPTESTIAEIWAELLGMDRVGVHENFFELGGHSLQATRLMARLHDTFAVELPLRSLFEMPTVAELALAVGARQDDEAKVTALLAELEGLSADEMRALLSAAQAGEGN